MHELNTHGDCDGLAAPLVSMPAPRGPGDHLRHHTNAALALASEPGAAPGPGYRRGHQLWVTNVGKALIWCPGLSTVAVAVAAKPSFAVTTSISVTAVLLAAAVGVTLVQNWLTSHEQPSTANRLAHQNLTVGTPDGARSAVAGLEPADGPGAVVTQGPGAGYLSGSSPTRRQSSSPVEK